MKNTVEILGTTHVATVRGMLVSIPILAIAIWVAGRRQGETASP